MENPTEFGFRRLTTKDKKIFDEYYQRMNDSWASTLSFASMIAWNHSIAIYHKKMGEYLCCLAQDIDQNHWWLLPLLGYYDKNSLEPVLQEVCHLMEQLHLPVYFTSVSEWMLPFYQEISEITWKVTKEEGSSDYLYSADAFKIAMNRKSRCYAYQYFVRTFHPQTVVIDHVNSQSFTELKSLYWCHSHTCSSCIYGCQLISIQNMIDTMEETGARGIAVYFDGQLIGYALITRERDQLVYHFKENLHGYRGLDIYLNQKCFELFQASANTVNYTEDMGLNGLRQYKQRLAEFRLAHKYELRLEDSQ